MNLIINKTLLLEDENFGQMAYNTGKYLKGIVGFGDGSKPDEAGNYPGYDKPEAELPEELLTLNESEESALNENALMHQQLMQQEAARKEAGEEAPGFLKKAAVVGGVGTGILGAGAGALYGLGKLAEGLGPVPVQESVIKTHTFEVDKNMLIQEAMNPKTGAGSTLADVEIKRSASPFFEMDSTKNGKNKDGDTFGSASDLFNKAKVKTVEDTNDITQENKAEKKEVRTRMVD